MIVYFIQNTSTKAVKIGYTSKDDVAKRLAQLQTGSCSKLVILKTVEGDTNLEKSLHFLCSDYHLNGEWFSFDCLDIVEKYLDLKTKKTDEPPKNSSNVSTLCDYLAFNTSIKFFMDDNDDSVWFKTSSFHKLTYSNSWKKYITDFDDTKQLRYILKDDKSSAYVSLKVFLKIVTDFKSPLAKQIKNWLCEEYIPNLISQ
jgi:hypothetical protein